MQSEEERLKTLRALFDQTPNFTAYMSGPDHIFELTNPGYIRLIAGRNVLGQGIREAMPELAGQGYFELLDRVYETGEAFVGRGMTVGLWAPDGTPRDAYVDFIYQPILDENGKSVGILVQGNDITDQKLASLRQQFITRATERLAVATDVEEALRLVALDAVETVADLCVVDMFEGGEGRRIASTHALPGDQELAHALLRFPLPGGVPANHAFAALEGEARVMPFTDEQAVASARNAEHAAIVGRIGYRSVGFVPLWHRGRLHGVMTMITTTRSGRMFTPDYQPMMTEVGRLASAALDNVWLIREREALLASERAARVSAEAANRAKDSFLAMLGHELRNPLAPILTAVQLMRMRGEESSAREQQIIERQARHLVRIVDDLLDISRITRGKLELREEQVELAAVVRKAIEIASPQIEQHQHELVVDLAPNLSMMGDEARLAQLIANLLTNAARYTPKGGRIELSTKRDDGHALICVRDNGIGIAAEVLPTIFEMFVQAPQPVDRATGGLGIGLTLVREIAQLHGGTAAAASEGLGKGTLMTVRLPLVPVSESGRTATLAKPSPGGLRVLVVDDNIDAATLLGDVIERSGHAVEVVHDGPTALERIAASTFDVAVVDIGLPRMSGHEVAETVRATYGANAPRLIALTGYGAQNDRERSRAAGFSEHLTKPVDAATLMRAIRPDLKAKS